MLGMREGINFGRSRTSFLRKIPKENIRQPLSRQISERKLKSSQRSLKRNKVGNGKLETFRTQAYSSTGILLIYHHFFELYQKSHTLLKHCDLLA